MSHLYPKYWVQRTADPDNRHTDCSFFVLDLTHDRAARYAAMAYATSILETDPTLARELRALVQECE